MSTDSKQTTIAFEEVDWTSRDSITLLFPGYKQEQLALVRQKNVSKSVNIEGFTLKTPYADQVLLRDTELILEPNRRQGLVGANGTGKTLLFQYMVDGTLFKQGFPKHLHVHHCKEIEGHGDNQTVLDTVVTSHPFRNILLKCETKLKELIDAAEIKAPLIDTLEWVQMHLRSVNSDTAVDRATKMLKVLGFDEAGLKKTISELSGGLKMRVALCCAFFIEAEMLLLDEPTNHLDFPSVLWLENRLRGYKGSFLLVSHDRELLNNVCTSVLLLEDKEIKYYQCGFKDFEKKKAAEDKKKADDVEKFLAKHKIVDFSTPLGKQREEKKQWSDRYTEKQVLLAGKFTFPAATPLENPENVTDPSQISLINLQNVRFSYDEARGLPFIFDKPISFNVLASTRVGVMGPNGAGKSTFLKLLTQKLTPTSGTITHHPNFTLAYFGQHSTAELDLELTPMEFMKREFPDHKEGLLRNHLQKTSIAGNAANTRMKNLSFSQRSCIIFAKLTYVSPHLLIMDEPTNFLDLESVDSLIGAANKYQGALLLVSHNRDFLKRCARGYLSIVPGQFLLFDNLKEAEKSTYTWIAAEEAGQQIDLKSMVGQSKQHGGDEKTDAKTPQKKGEFVFGKTASTEAVKTAPKPAAAPAEDKKAAAGGNTTARGGQQQGGKQQGGRGKQQGPGQRDNKHSGGRGRGGGQQQRGGRGGHRNF